MSIFTVGLANLAIEAAGQGLKTVLPKLNDWILDTDSTGVALEQKYVTRTVTLPDGQSVSIQIKLEGPVLEKLAARLGGDSTPAYQNFVLDIESSPLVSVEGGLNLFGLITLGV